MSTVANSAGVTGRTAASRCRELRQRVVVQDLAVERSAVPAPNMPPQRDDVVEPRAAACPRNAGEREFRFAPAGETGSDAEGDPALAEQIQRQDRVRGKDRIPQRREQSGGAEGDPLGPGGERAEQGQRIDRHLGQCVADPDRVETEAFGFGRDGDHFGGGAPGVEDGPIRRNDKTEFMPRASRRRGIASIPSREWRCHARLAQDVGHGHRIRRRTAGLAGPAYAALRAGASGFLVKDAPADEILVAIRGVLRGDSMVSPSVTKRLLDRYLADDRDAGESARLEKLTEREKDVLALIARGLANSEIAAKLYIGETTVKTHVGRILAKLSLRDRVHAVVFAYESSLVRAGG